MAGRNGHPKTPKPTRRDLRLASAIGAAVVESIGPKLDSIIGQLESHGAKLDQLVSGAAGVGRVVALEKRVDELERRR